MTPLLWFRIGAVLTLLVALFTGYLWIDHAFTERDQLRSKVTDLSDALEATQQARAADVKALTGRLADSKRLASANKEVINAIPQLVPAGTPALPPGFRVLHDAAAQGLPPAPDGADAAPVPVEDAATTVADNYSGCLDTGSQLERLQQWIRDQTLTPTLPKASAP